MATCVTQERMRLFLANEMSVQEEGELWSHVEVCRCCREQLDELCHGGDLALFRRRARTEAALPPGMLEQIVALRGSASTSHLTPPRGVHLDEHQRETHDAGSEARGRDADDDPEPTVC